MGSKSPASSYKQKEREPSYRAFKKETKNGEPRDLVPTCSDHALVTVVLFWPGLVSGSTMPSTGLSIVLNPNIPSPYDPGPELYLTFDEPPSQHFNLLLQTHLVP